MKKLACGILAALAIVSAGAAEVQWLTDLPKAQAQAKAEKKLVLLDFTGSDWCGWCIRLDKEVFSTPEFASYARTNLVLMEVDFPRAKEQPEAVKTANEALLKKYGVEGFPTLIVLNSEGKKVGELGYEVGGPKPFIEKLQAMKAK